MSKLKFKYSIGEMVSPITSKSEGIFNKSMIIARRSTEDSNGSVLLEYLLSQYIMSQYTKQWVYETEIKILD